MLKELAARAVVTGAMERLSNNPGSCDEAILRAHRTGQKHSYSM
jgi:hypothetical protein